MNLRVLACGTLVAALFAACSDASPTEEPLADGDDTDGGSKKDAARDATPADGSDVDGGAPDGDAPVVLEPGELLPGGATTTTNTSIGAFTVRAANLTLERNASFEAGLQLVQLQWVVAPGRTDIDGLGPTFNAVSCPACHVRNGRGSIGTILLRIGLGDQGSPDPTYGGQLQPFGIAGVPGEGTPVRSENPSTKSLADGTVVPLVRPTYVISQPNLGPFGADLRISPRIAPQLVGQGLIEGLTEADILAHEDAEDRDGDGISGRARWLGSGSARRLGRFGWKGAMATVEDQTAGAFAEDLGITSPLHPSENCPPAQTACLSAPTGGSPELIASRLHAASAYVRLLGVPPRREGDSDEVLRGKGVFRQIGCGGCHTPSFVTHGTTIEPELADQTIWPYSDFLLHDLGEGLADHRGEGNATGTEWRTSPLWSLGLLPTVNGELRLLHDGRATTFEQAILWHDGEAKTSRGAYEKLPAAARRSLDAFLGSL